MKKIERKLIVIDEEKCDGCGECIPHCAEGAIVMENGKAKLKAENLCDGLGECLGTCPQDAIKIITQSADPFDEAAVQKELAQKACPSVSRFPACPSTKVTQAAKTSTGSKADLQNWPIQLHLLPVSAPFFNDADILIAADCTAFAYESFHSDILKHKTLIIACPKLDDTENYIPKLSGMFKNNSVKSVTVAHMEVPCCFALITIVEKALEDSGKGIPLTKINVKVRGN